jgi:hypothetical protein
MSTANSIHFKHHPLMKGVSQYAAFKALVTNITFATVKQRKIDMQGNKLRLPRMCKTIMSF